jgi:hypothetical protein
VRGRKEGGGRKGERGEGRGGERRIMGWIFVLPSTALHCTCYPVQPGVLGRGREEEGGRRKKEEAGEGEEKGGLHFTVTPSSLGDVREEEGSREQGAGRRKEGKEEEGG